jgi:hypothetical protein
VVRSRRAGVSTRLVVRLSYEVEITKVATMKVAHLFVIAVGTMALHVCGSALAEDNLINDPSLEKADIGLYLADWGGYNSQPRDAYRVEIVAGGRTGKKAMQLEGDGRYVVMPANRIQIDRTHRYVARGWVMLEGDARTSADVKMLYFDASNDYIGETRLGFVRPRDKWQLVTMTDRIKDEPRAFYVALAVSLVGKGKAVFDDLELMAFDAKTLPSDFEDKYGRTLSPEMQILARRIGAWNTKTTIKPGKWLPDGAASEGVETVEWMLNDLFIQGKTKNADGAESLWLMTYDEQDGIFRSWYFDSYGNHPRVQSTGKWDEKKQQLTFESPPDSTGVRSISTVRFTDEDRVDSSWALRDRDGSIVMEGEGTNSRRKR